MRNFLEWASVAFPSLMAVVSGAGLMMFKPESTRAKMLCIAVMLGFATIVSSIIYWDQLSSQTAEIAFTVGDGGPFILETQNLKYARVLVTNKSRADATCRLFLTHLENLDPKQSVMGNDAILLAAGNTGGEGYQEQLIGPDFRITFDLAFIRIETDALQIQSRQDQFLNIHQAPLPRGDYKLTIRTNGKNCVSDPYEIVLRYGGWPNLKVQSGRTAPVDERVPSSWPLPHS